MLVHRLVAFVVDFEASKDASEAQHAEWVSTRMRLAVLNAMSSVLLSSTPCSPPPLQPPSPVSPTAGTTHNTTTAPQSPPSLSAASLTPTKLSRTQTNGEAGTPLPAGLEVAAGSGVNASSASVSGAAALAAAAADGGMVKLSDVVLAAMHDSGTAALVLQWLRRLCSDATILLLERPAMHQVHTAFLTDRVLVWLGTTVPRVSLNSLQTCKL